jgi:tryptophan synthase alpha chain
MDQARLNYFQRLADLKLKSPISVGFGIDNREALGLVHKNARAAIIGSAFLKSCGEGSDYLARAESFVKGLSA